jgi:hypothetical protein
VNCKPITFCNVSPGTFKCMRKKLKDAGIHIPSGNKGKLSGMGAVADFEWDGESKLVVIITKKPCIVSYETVACRIEDLVRECQAR